MTTADPTPPRTPAEALRWAAARVRDRLVASPDIAGHAVAAWLDVWARDLDSGPATTRAEALDLDAVEGRADEAAAHTARQGWACCEAHASSEDVTPLVAEVRRLREQLENARGWSDLKEGELAGANAQRDAARARVAELEAEQVRWRAEVAEVHRLQGNVAAVLGVQTDWDEAGRKAVVDAACRLVGNLADAERRVAELELAGVPATVYRLPAEPPDTFTELWDRDGGRWARKRWPFQADGSPAEPGTVSWMWERNGLGERQRWPGLLGYGPLSTTPPAGTEADHG